MMMLKIKKRLILLLVGSTAVVSTNPTHPACSRDDVEYYLSKGFTTEQITSICAASSSFPSDKANRSTISSPEHVSAPPTPDEPDQARPTENSFVENEQFLKIAIRGHDIFVTPESLHYTLRKCIEYGQEDLFGFASRACPEVMYMIGRKGLDVVKASKKYLIYGPGEVRVSGDIKWKIVDGLADASPEERESVLAKLDSGVQTAIPIREDISLERVAQILKDLAF